MFDLKSKLRNAFGVLGEPPAPPVEYSNHGNNGERIVFEIVHTLIEYQDRDIRRGTRWQKISIEEVTRQAMKRGVSNSVCVQIVRYLINKDAAIRERFSDDTIARVQ